MAKSNILNSKLLKVAVQAAVTIAALWIVLGKTDLPLLTSIISHANPWYLLGAMLFFNVSKVANAIRLNRFFKVSGLNLSAWYNLKLYYLGMFYNLFLPGGIGGDGYKIYVLRKNHDIKVLDIFSAVFWDRVCGIFALVFLSAILLVPSSFSMLYPAQVQWAWIVAAACYPLSLLLTWLFYRHFMPVFLVTAVESIIVQATQVVSAWFILMALPVNDAQVRYLLLHQVDYLAIFLVSTVATVLPITIGGLGAREVTFNYALDHLRLESEYGVALALIFFALAAISSLFGVLSKIRHDEGAVNAGAPGSVPPEAQGEDR